MGGRTFDAVELRYRKTKFHVVRIIVLFLIHYQIKVFLILYLIRAWIELNNIVSFHTQYCIDDVMHSKACLVHQCELMIFSNMP